jgi:hypothetical protein
VCNNTLRLLDNAIELQNEIYSDQVALNLALWKEGILWSGIDNRDEDGLYSDPQHKERVFHKNAEVIFDGIGENSLRVRALSPQLYWRNKIVPFEMRKTIVFHPNSPHSEIGKIKRFREYISLG